MKKTYAYLKGSNVYKYIFLIKFYPDHKCQKNNKQQY